MVIPICLQMDSKNRNMKTEQQERQQPRHENVSRVKGEHATA